MWEILKKDRADLVWYASLTLYFFVYLYLIFIFISLL